MSLPPHHHAIRRDGQRVTRCRGRVKVNASGVWQPDPLRERPSGLFTHHTCIAPCFSAGEKGPALKYGASMVWRSDRTQVRLTEGALKSGERTRLKAARTVDGRWPNAVCVSGIPLQRVTNKRRVCLLLKNPEGLLLRRVESLWCGEGRQCNVNLGYRAGDDFFTAHINE